MFEHLNFFKYYKDNKKISKLLDEHFQEIVYNWCLIHYAKQYDINTWHIYLFSRWQTSLNDNIKPIKNYKSIFKKKIIKQYLKTNQLNSSSNIYETYFSHRINTNPKTPVYYDKTKFKYIINDFINSGIYSLLK